MTAYAAEAFNNWIFLKLISIFLRDAWRYPISVNLECNYISAIFWPTIRFTNGLEFYLFCIKKERIYNFWLFFLNLFGKLFLRSKFLRNILEQSPTTYIWINLITWTQFLNLIRQILLIRNGAFLLELFLPRVWTVSNKILIAYLLTRFLLLFWALNQSSDPHLWELNRSCGPSWQVSAATCFSSLCLRLSWVRFSSACIVTVNLWSILSESFSSLSFCCWFCRLRNWNISSKLLPSLAWLLVYFIF